MEQLRKVFRSSDHRCEVCVCVAVVWIELMSSNDKQFVVLSGSDEENDINFSD